MAGELTHRGRRLRIVTLAEQPEMADPMWEDINSKGFAEFMYHDAVADRCFGELGRRFAEFQFALVGEDDRLSVAGNCVPFRWDEPLDDLPDTGWDFVLERGVTDHETGRRANVASALQIVVRTDLLGTGLSTAGLRAMRSIVASSGLRDLVAPVRPSGKHRYPLTPMDRYIAWRREDGLSRDPWLRVHERAGARLLKVAPRSMEIAGTVAEWEAWTDMAFPDSGDYVVPQALSPITIDRDADRGVYLEPNVWMHHAVAS